MKKFSALIAAFAITAAIMPSAYADNSDYIGFYKAVDADGISFAELNILSCDEDSFTIEFRRVKNDVEKITYEFAEGTINEADGIGSTTFKATLTASGATLPGTTTLSFVNEELVKITCISYQNELFYEGLMKKTAQTPSPSENNSSSEKTTSEDVNISVNGSKIAFEGDVKPRIIKDSTYVPLRSILSNLGINVYWDEYDKNTILKEQLITCTKNSTILQFARTLNDTGANTWTLKKWENTTTDTPGENIDIIYLQPVLIENSSYIPLRIVSESFGAVVNWDEITRTVSINSDTTNEFMYAPETIASIEDFTQSLAQAYITSDFTSVTPYATPYFAPQGKFYKFDARDQWNEVSLRIFTGGFVDVIALPASTEVETEEVQPSVSEAVTEIPSQQPDEAIHNGEVSIFEPVTEEITETEPVETEPTQVPQNDTENITTGDEETSAQTSEI